MQSYRIMIGDIGCNGLESSCRLARACTWGHRSYHAASQSPNPSRMWGLQQLIPPGLSYKLCKSQIEITYMMHHVPFLN
jgi:hypothetical protein